MQNQFGSKLVTLEASGHLLDAVVPYDFSLSEGDKAAIAVDPERCYYFDQEQSWLCNRLMI